MPADFSYDDAFSRNLGWVTSEEQRRLRRARIAIAGLGGVGGSHLLTLARLVQSFGRERVYVELQRYGTRESELVLRRALELARAVRIPVVATGGVRHAAPGERPILDVLTAVRLRTPLDALGRRLDDGTHHDRDRQGLHAAARAHARLAARRRHGRLD